MGQRALRTHSLLAPGFSFSCSGAGPSGDQVKETTGSDFPGIASGVLLQKPVIANGPSFGPGKERPL